MQLKKTLYRTIVLFVLITFSFAFVFIENTDNKAKPIKEVMEVAKQQYSQMLKHSSELKNYPRTTDKNGNTKYVSIDDWTGGFWPGNLWYLYEYTQDANFKKEALRWTESLESNQFNKSHHDLGFMMYCSYGNAYRITQNKKYKDILIQSAKSLISRFNPTVGSIKSWDYRASWDGKTVWYYPVIMDNLMNLELLFFATKETGDPIYRNVAIKHAEATLKNHVRKDYSSYHVVNYDSVTGKVLNRQTCQGYADNSTWARGQAWGIYGFTMIYRETQDVRFLEAAKGMANFYINHPNLPSDKIPYWDFNVNQKGFTPDWKYNPNLFSYIPRDVSSAAIVSSALFELSEQLGINGKEYKDFALSTINTLSSSAYLADTGTNGYFILKHSVGSFPHGNEIDVPLVYADYYFLEALLRNNQLTKISAP
ncbi:glycoside hydrolase family 88 protein [Sediminibacterium sp.]|uniref:glycoside hydrolase family 88 protein n=1 Tax=Sediminibacterium sp. TaxID=1917865 RepID=UPI00273469BC|nr:glycoside hydrolase family 88 protein [Sediminibacterium sp.]MDP3394604.1 glycoside hydrolase family 88 protein [Sediminibacterium sp.]MDP3568439.1 glycoside hydrolase family 88 protein [Sediminibacterium sp.]